MKNQKRTKFDCECCGLTFFTYTSDQEKEEEFQETYGHSQEESEQDIVSVCDRCYENIKRIKIGGCL